MVKPYDQFSMEIEAVKTKMKNCCAIDEQCCIGETIKNLRSRIDIKLLSNKKDYLK